MVELRLLLEKPSNYKKGFFHFTLRNGEIKDIYGVLYIPGLRKNLLSIGSLTDEGIIVSFDDQKCFFHSRGIKKIIAEGSYNRKNGLYQLTTLNVDVVANLAESKFQKACT